MVLLLYLYLYSTRLDATPLDSTLLYSLFSILYSLLSTLYSLLYSPLYSYSCSCSYSYSYSTLPYSTLPYSTLPYPTPAPAPPPPTQIQPPYHHHTTTIPPNHNHSQEWYYCTTLTFWGGRGWVRTLKHLCFMLFKVLHRMVVFSRIEVVHTHVLGVVRHAFGTNKRPWSKWQSSVQQRLRKRKKTWIQRRWWTPPRKSFSTAQAFSFSTERPRQKNKN